MSGTQGATDVVEEPWSVAMSGTQGATDVVE